MTRTELLHLPTEVLQKICRNLCSHCRDTNVEPKFGKNGPDGWSGDYVVGGNPLVEKPALNYLSRCCQRLRDIAQPVLFHHVVQNATYRALGDLRPKMVLDSFIRLAVEKPRLASNIEWFDFEEMCYIDDISESDAQYFDEVASRRAISLPPRWWSFEEDERDAVLLILLLHLLPNLHKLHVVLYADWAHEGLVGMLEGMKPIANIQKLSLAHHDTEYGFGLQEKLALIAPLSGLTSLETHMCVGAGAHVAFASLTTLKLGLTMLPYDDLRGLLQHCNKLESFTYEAGALSQDNDEDEASPAEIIAALRPARETLRHLSVSWVSSFRADYSHETYNETAMIQKLPFPKLETAVLGQNSIYLPRDHPDGPSDVSLVQIWPKSIKSIEFDFVRSMPHEDVVELSEAVAAGEFPSLKRVAVNASYFGTDPRALWEKDESEMLRAKFSEGGVSFELQTPPVYSSES